MTNAERNLVVECLESYRRWLGNSGSDKREMLENLIDRFRSAKVSDAKPVPATESTTVTVNVARRRLVAEAQEQIERIIEMCEQVAEYDSSSAQDFALSVQEKAESIGEWIDEHGDITEKQRDALDNMESGISRWIR